MIMLVSHGYLTSIKVPRKSNIIGSNNMAKSVKRNGYTLTPLGKKVIKDFNDEIDNLVNSLNSGKIKKAG